MRKRLFYLMILVGIVSGISRAQPEACAVENTRAYGSHTVLWVYKDPYSVPFENTIESLNASCYGDECLQSLPVLGRLMPTSDWYQVAINNHDQVGWVQLTTRGRLIGDCDTVPLVPVLFKTHIETNRQINIVMPATVDWSQNSQYIAVTDNRSGLRIFDIHGRVILQDAAGREPVFSPNGQWLAYSRFPQSTDVDVHHVLIRFDDTMIVEDILTSTQLTFLTSDTVLVTQLDTENNQRLAVFDLRTWEVIRYFEHHESPPPPANMQTNTRNPAHYMLDSSGQYLIAYQGIMPTGGLDNQTYERMILQVWDFETGEFLWYADRVNEGDIDHVWTLEDNDQLFLGTHSGKSHSAARDLTDMTSMLRLWDLETGMLIDEREVGRAFAVSENGRTILSSNYRTPIENFSAELIQLPSFDTLETLPDDSYSAYIDLASNGQSAVLVCQAALQFLPLVRLWHIDTGITELTASHPVDLSADGLHLLTSGGAYYTDGELHDWQRADTIIRLWDTRNQHVIGTYTALHELEQIQFSPDGQYIVFMDSTNLQWIPTSQLIDRQSP